MDKEFKYTINANFNRKVQEQTYGGEKYTSFNPGVSFSVKTDEDLSSQDKREMAEELYMTARYVVEEAIKQRKEEIQGKRDEDDFLEDAQLAWDRMEERAEERGEEFPKSVNPDKIAPPLFEREDN